MRTCVAFILVVIASFGSTQASSAARQKATVSLEGTPLSPDLLNKILALIEEHGVDVELSSTVANRLGFASKGSVWPAREIGAREDESDSSTPLHNLWVHPGANGDFLVSHWADGASDLMRVSRDGKVVKAMIDDPGGVGSESIPVAVAQNEVNAEFEFWNRNVERAGYWWTCTGELKGATPVNPQRKIEACTWLIQSGGESASDTAHAYVSRAWAHGREHADETREDLLQAVKLDPASSAAWAQLCSLQNSIDKDTHQAAQSCAKALALAPHSPEAWTFSGDVHLRDKEYDPAIADYSHAIKLGARWMWPFDNRGEAYLRTNQIDRAIEDFNKVIEISPDYAMGYLDRGLAEMKRNNLDAAIEDFQHGISVDARCAGCFFGRGLVKHAKADVAGGDADIAKAKTIDSKVIDDLAEDGITLQ
jgi:tetratricopeptide (TPR) repeat protein